MPRPYVGPKLWLDQRRGTWTIDGGCKLPKAGDIQPMTDERRDGEGMTEFTMRRIRNEHIDECAKAVPTNWCDPLLTGPKKVGDLPARETEALLRGIQDRIRKLKR